MFPQWINNLKFPEPELQEGLFVFKVSLGEAWRRIVIDAENSLDQLALCIIGAFEFDGDHLYQFLLPQKNGTTLAVECPAIDSADLTTDEFAIGHLTLEVGQSMRFEYDFGADWQFTVKLEKIKPPNADISLPMIVDSFGEAPSEYDDEW